MLDKIPEGSAAIAVVIAILTKPAGSFTALILKSIAESDQDARLRRVVPWVALSVAVLAGSAVYVLVKAGML